MKKNLRLKSAMFFLALLMTISLICAATSYSRSNPNYGLFDSYVKENGLLQFNEQVCAEGQDFVLQIAPYGCTPAVVRSDLLEEQNVPVFCQLAATKINPLIDVKAIESISFSGQYSKEISGVGFHPAKAALGVQEDLNNPVLNNIGYVVVVLKKQESEKDMPEFVSGNLTARIEYNIKDAFGIGESTFYLPLLDSSVWEKQKNRYSFWAGRGYLKAEEIEPNNAAISVYNDINRISSVRLNKGETSDSIYLPGFDCLAGVKLKLDGLENPNTRAKFEINGEIVEVIKGEKFLDNKCTLVDLKKEGLNEKATINCKEDETSYFFGSKNFDLMIKPKVKLDFPGANESGYSVGDYLYQADDGNFVYLGYAGMINSTENSYVYLVSIPEKRTDNKLTDSELKSVSSLVEKLEMKKVSSVGLVNALGQIGNLYLGAGTLLYKWLVGGQGIKRFGYLESASVFGKTVKFEGFADAFDSELKDDAKNNYEKAMKDYDDIIKNYGSESYIESSEGKVMTYGEAALIKEISLAESLGQRQTIRNLCEQLLRDYSNSDFATTEYILNECQDKAKLSNSEISSTNLMINGEVKTVSFMGIYEPSFDDFGADILIKGPNKKQDVVSLKKNEIVYLDDFRAGENLNEYIQLLDLGEDSATVKYYIKSESTVVGIAKSGFSTYTQTLKKGVQETISGYTFTVTHINLKKLAKVSVIPNIDNTGSSANFSFQIGIEKRAIQLSPEMTKEKIDSLNEKITEWESRSESLGNIVKGLKGACLAGGAFLTVKNFIENTDGKAIARQNVMRGTGGFYEQCEKNVGSGKPYASVEECLLDKSDEIDKQVDAMYQLITSQNNQLESIDNSCKITTDWEFITEKQVNTSCFKEKYLTSSKDELKKLNSVTCGNENIDINKFVDSLKPEQVSSEELRDLALYASAGSSLSNIASVRSKTIICDIYARTKEENVRTSFAEKTGFSEANVYSFEKIQNKITFTQDVAWSFVSNKYQDPSVIKSDAHVQNYKDSVSGNEYILVLDNDNIVKETYKITGTANGKNILEKYEGTDPNIKGNPLKLIFDKKTSSSYNNKYENPEAKYYETEPYKGMPALVPFDEGKGWYAYLKQTVPVGGNIASYDASGRVSSFYLCNVGENHKEEKMAGDDICEMINLGTGQPYNEFPGISDKSETAKIVRVAIEAVNDASKQYKQGVSRIRVKDISGKSWYVKVGSPAVDIPDLQCQDFMSPTDCQWLFNLCDPVICPPSRCDFGGSYPVSDVIQSGIIGSIMLCLPNFNKGIYIPVCLTGIKAGIDSLLSVYKSYRDCLQDSLDNGKMIGICDEINSVYMCDFFWRQGLPIANLIVPKVIEMLFQQNVRGGGEYLGVASAWSAASNSVEYFTQYYAANSYRAFQARTIEEAGEEVCKNFASGVYANGGDLLEQLTEPDSPPQFYGRFDEIPFTTATVPPVSQYKVFYHIYAGKDSRAYYEVYLTAGAGSSYYQDISTKYLVDSGYIAVGEYASQTKDFTAPAGYKQLCIRVNEFEQCGFQQASTSYAVNYVTDQYLSEQANSTSIQSESECISGSASVYSVLNPNVQSTAESLINPEIYNSGIIRICSTQNPGKGTDPKADAEGSRWIDVGKCSSDGKIRCWLDTNSVANVIKDTSIENQTLSSLNSYSQQVLANENNYLSDAEVDQKIKDIKEESNLNNKINSVNDLIGKVFWNRHKVALLSIRGDAYMNLAIMAFSKIKAGEISSSSGSTSTTTTVQTNNTNSNAKTEAFNELPNANLDPSPDAKILSDRLTLYENVINSMAEKYGVSSDMIKAIISQESDGIASAVGDDGVSIGLMQISSVAAEDVGMAIQFNNNAKEPAVNIEIGTAYYKILYSKYNDERLALAAYNWGQGNIDKVCKDKKWENCEAIPDSVLQYVSNVLGYRNAFSSVTTSV
jgi:hypothetical protein